MIDNIVLVITGTHHDRETSELLEKCHPLGMFDAISTLAVSATPADLYRMVLVDTPLGAPLQPLQPCRSRSHNRRSSRSRSCSRSRRSRSRE